MLIRDTTTQQHVQQPNAIQIPVINISYIEFTPSLIISSLFSAPCLPHLPIVSLQFVDFLTVQFRSGLPPVAIIFMWILQSFYVWYILHAYSLYRRIMCISLTISFGLSPITSQRLQGPCILPLPLTAPFYYASPLGIGM